MINSALTLNKEFKHRAKALDLSPKVLGNGNFNATIALVGEGPGEREISTGIPFSGGSGKVLWKELRRHGFVRQDVWCSNVVKRQISLSSAKGANLKDTVSAGESYSWEQLLLWELGQLPNLRVVVVLGNRALTALTGNKGITLWRGSVFERITIPGRTVDVVATFNPAMVLREPRWEVVFAFDLGRVDRVVRRVYKPHVIDHIINPTSKEAHSWIRLCKNQNGKPAPVAYDIETMGGQMACIGLAFDAHRAMCINFRDETTNRWALQEEADVRLAIADLFSHPKVRLVAQNGNYDSQFLWFKERIYVRPNYFDTMLGHHTLYPTLPHGLAFLTSHTY